MKRLLSSFAAIFWIAVVGACCPDLDAPNHHACFWIAGMIFATAAAFLALRVGENVLRTALLAGDGPEENETQP